MRTTVDTTDDLLRRAKQRAADERGPLREIFEAALRASLSGQPKAGGYKLRWTTEEGALMPGVDLDDRVSLFDIMDGAKK